MMDAFEVLDELCWRKIFKRMKPEDIYQCSLVCDRFDWILQDTKTEWMLELVLPSIIPYLECQEPRQSPNEFAMNYLPKKIKTWKDLYNCRSVCKAWRDTIDAYMSRDSHRFSGPVALVDAFGMNELLLQEGPGWSRFTDNVQLSDFIATFKETNRNPFPGRKAIVFDLIVEEMRPVQMVNGGRIEFEIGIDENGNIFQDDEDEDADANDVEERRDQFYEKRDEFFQLFGRFLWHANIGEGQHEGAYMENIIAYLSHLPNIKELTVGSTARIGSGDTHGMWGRIDVAKLPELRDLRTLVFEMVPRALGIALLTKYGPQLTELEMTSKSNNLFFFKMQMDLMASLRSLNITLSNAHFIHLFSALQDLHSPLEDLKLILFNTNDWLRRYQENLAEEMGEPTIFKMDKLIRSIRRLPLINLSIELHRGQLSDSGEPIFVQHLNHSIRTINLTAKFSSYPSPPIHILLNFLPSLKSLTSFNLVYEYEADRNLNELALPPPDKVAAVSVTEFISENEAQLYQSNIWGKVPSLQTFSMKYKRPQNSTQKTFTRKEYQVEMAKNGIAAIEIKDESEDVFYF